jgi:hypothetical protein
VTFSQAGSYTFRATVTDQDGLCITSDVTVTVVQTATSIMVSPGTASVAVKKTQHFTAVELDQFGSPMTRQPSFTWALASGVGSISHTGLYTAPSTTAHGQAASVRVTGGSLSGSATIQVNTPPVITRVASASLNPLTGTSAALSISATDAGYLASRLTYTWVQISGPADMTFSSSNGTSSANKLTAYFTQAGTYQLQVTVRDPSGATVTSKVTVAVRQKATAIEVTPASAAVSVQSTLQLRAVARDQFGQAMAAQPRFTWTVTSGVGSISHAGLYTAPSTTANGQSASVRVKAGSLSASVILTVANIPGQDISKPGRLF